MNEKSLQELEQELYNAEQQREDCANRIRGAYSVLDMKPEVDRLQHSIKKLRRIPPRVFDRMVKEIGVNENRVLAISHMQFYYASDGTFLVSVTPDSKANDDSILFSFKLNYLDGLASYFDMEIAKDNFIKFLESSVSSSKKNLSETACKRISIAAKGFSAAAEQFDKRVKRYKELVKAGDKAASNTEKLLAEQKETDRKISNIKRRLEDVQHLEVYKQDYQKSIRAMIINGTYTAYSVARLANQNRVDVLSATEQKLFELEDIDAQLSKELGKAPETILAYDGTKKVIGFLNNGKAKEVIEYLKLPSDYMPTLSADDVTKVRGALLHAEDPRYIFGRCGYKISEENYENFMRGLGTLNRDRASWILEQERIRGEINESEKLAESYRIPLEN